MKESVKEVAEIKREISATARNIRIAEGSIKEHEKRIEMEKRQIVQFISWQSALEWTLEDVEG